MLNKLGLTTLYLAALALQGCGGNTEKNIVEKLKQKDQILIIHSTKNSACSLFADQFKKLGTKSVIFDSPSDATSCKTYGRTKGDILDESAVCVETTLADFSDNEDISLLEDETKSCVIGANN